MKKKSKSFSSFHLGLISVLLGGLLVLLVGASQVGYGWLQVPAEQGDQIMYITASRSFADTGKINTTTITPATLNQNRSSNFFYQPGYPLIMGTIYKIFGYGQLQTLLFTFFCYLVSLGSIYLLAARFYDVRTAILAALLYGTYPGVVSFCFSAMSEVPTAAAATFAVCSFVYLSERKKLFLGPCLLALPFLFRELGALLVLTMGATLVLPWTKTSLKKSSIFMGSSVVLLAAIYFSPWVSDHASLIKASYWRPMSFSAMYSDAFEMFNFNPTAKQWLKFLPRRLWDTTLWQVGGYWRTLPSWESFCFFLHLTLIPIGVFFGLKRKDGLALGTALYVSFYFGVSLCLYIIFPRAMLMTLPFCLILFVHFLFDLVPKSHWKNGVAGLVALCWLLLGVWTYQNAGLYRNKDHVAESKACVDFISELQGKSQGLIVTPHYVCGIDYVFWHYPTKWSFIPANAETLKLLNKKYPISTLLITNENPAELKAIEGAFPEVGLKLQKIVPWHEVKLYVYKTQVESKVD